MSYKTILELALAVAINALVVRMIILTERAKIRKHAEWAKNLSEWEESHSPTLGTRRK